MNWGKFFLNLGGVAAAGFGGVVTQSGGSLSKGTVLTGVLVPVLANVLGLFQQPPHTEG